LLCVLHQSGMPLGYHPHVTLPQENPLVWEPPLQLKISVLLMFSVHANLLFKLLLLLLFKLLLLQTSFQWLGCFQFLRFPFKSQVLKLSLVFCWFLLGLALLGFTLLGFVFINYNLVWIFFPSSLFIDPYFSSVIFQVYGLDFPMFEFPIFALCHHASKEYGPNSTSAQFFKVKQVHQVLFNF
jgi:hypothetical protein